MLINFITDTDLLTYYPQLGKYIPNTQVDYNPQISEAFELLQADLFNSGIDVKLLGTPLDLLRPVNSTQIQNTLTEALIDYVDLPKTFDYVVRLQGYKRFCINVPFIFSGSYIVSLYGSNDLNVSITSPPQNWSKIIDIEVSEQILYSKKFEHEYTYYRVEVNSNNAQFSIKINTFLSETWIDKLIIYKALSLIGMANRKEQGDYSDLMYTNYDSLYQSLFAGVKMYIDANKNNLPESTEINNMKSIEFFR